MTMGSVFPERIYLKPLQGKKVILRAAAVGGAGEDHQGVLEVFEDPQGAGEAFKDRRGEEEAFKDHRGAEEEEEVAPKDGLGEEEEDHEEEEVQGGGRPRNIEGKVNVVNL